MVSMKETKTQYRGYIMTSKPILYIVIPCYNEEKVLPETEPLFLQTLRGMISEGKIAEESRPTGEIGGRKYDLSDKP